MPKKQTFFQQKLDDGTIQFCGGQRVPYDTWLSLCNPRQVIRVTLQMQRHPKTSAQLGYWYAVVLPFVCGALLEMGYDRLFSVSVGDLSAGVKTTVDTVDLLLKTLFMVHTQADTLPLKRKMTDEQMSELIEFTIRWVAENLQVAVPPPTGVE